MKLIRFFKVLVETNFKTLYFNFRYLPFKQAIKLPIYLSRKVFIRKMIGKIIIEGEAYRKMITIGYPCVGIFDDRRSRSIWHVTGTVIFKGIASIGHGSKISVDGELVLGNNFVITAESTILCSKKVVFGDDCLLSWDVLLMDTDLHTIRDKSEKIINEPKEIIVGKRVWFGCRCLVLKGAVIPDYSIIAANSLISKKLEGTHHLFAGNPPRAVRDDIWWD